MKEECVICGAKSAFKTNRTHLNREILYSLWSCKACSVEFWTPFKNPGGEWYEKDERYSSANANPALRPNWHQIKTINLLKPLTGKVLDVGCGTGNFLGWAKNQGWDVYGLDFDRNAIESSFKNFGIQNVELSDAVTYSKNTLHKFNLITFFDVLEHIDNHEEFINAVSSMLPDRGFIAMSMPYQFGSEWLMPHDLPPRHLTRWDEKSIEHFLTKHGFEIKYLKKERAKFWFILMKVRFRYGKNLSFNVVKKVQTGKDKFLSSDASIFNIEKMLHTAARIKDLVLFGIPAVFIWLYFLCKRSKYIGLFVLAQKKSV